MKNIITIVCFSFLGTMTYGQVTNDAMYFPLPGNWTDNLPKVRLFENWGMRYGVPSGTHVFSVASSLVVGYPMTGQDWGIGNIYGSGAFALGTTSPRGRFDVDGPGDIFLADEVNGAGSNQSIFLPGHIYVAPFAGNDVALIQARRRDDTGNVALRFRTTNNGVITESLQIQPNGNVGIGTIAPSTKLSFGTNFSSRMVSLYDATGDWYGLGMGSYQMRLQVGSANARFSFFAGDASEIMTVKGSGNVGIGTTSPDQKLTVKGKIHSEEVIVDLSVPAPDYVFEPNYSLTPLDEVQAYIAHHKHLPEVPSAKEMEKDGVKVGEMEMILLKKIEELTLHLIEKENQLKKMEERLQRLEKK